MKAPRRKSLHVGIFGPGLSGKTTLAKYLSRRYWALNGIKSIVLDIHREDWGPQAWVTDNEHQFLRMVAMETKCAVWVEEASQTIKRDKTKGHLFTSIRHRGHRMHVVGHSVSSLLPEMREQLQTLFLFRQSPEALDYWVNLLSDKRIYSAAQLAQYEFLWCRLYYDPQAHILTM